MAATSGPAPALSASMASLVSAFAAPAPAAMVAGSGGAGGVAGASAANGNWKILMQKRLLARKQRQEIRWAELVHKCGALAVETKTLRDTYESVSEELSSVKRERNTLRSQVDVMKGAGGSSVDASALLRVKELEQELSDRNNELRVLYKEKGDHLKALLDGETEAKNAKRAAADAEARAADAVREREQLRAEVGALRQEIADMTTAKQIMDQELTAIQLAYVGLMETNTKLQRDYDALIERMLAKAAEDANRMNEANNFYESMVLKKKQAETIAAAEAAVTGVVDGSRRSMLDAYGAGPAGSEIPSQMTNCVRAHEREGFFVDYNVSGDSIATGGGEPVICVYGAHPTTGDRAQRLTGFSASITSVAYSQSHELLLGSSADKSVRVFSTRSERTHTVLTGHSSKVIRALFSPNGSQIVSGSNDRALKIWDVERGACLKTVSVPKSVQDVALSADGNIVISAHVNGKIMMFDARTTDLIAAMDVTDAGHLVTSLAVCGDALLATVRDSTLRLFDVRMHSQMTEYKHSSFVVGTNFSRSCFSPDGTTVCAGGADGAIYFWSRLGVFDSAVMGVRDQAITGLCWRPTGRSVAAMTKRGDLLVFE